MHADTLFHGYRYTVEVNLAESAKCWLFDQVTGIIQNACYCLFSTDLNKIFTCRPQEKIIVEFIKTTCSKVFTPLIPNTVLLSEWSSAVFISLVIDVHESLVCPEQLNSAVLQEKSPSSLVFQHFCVFEPFPTMTVWFWDASFRTERLIRSYYRRFKHSLMLQKEKPCIKSRGVNTFEHNEDECIFLVLPKLSYFLI